ncbi:MAG TPA: ABC transporter permease [Candidatus Limnocylindria bacterium]|nr:ABC transporter permease [Candidatus Limnocylindria bacterium]
MTAAATEAPPRISRRRRVIFFALFFVGLAVLWEGLKVLGGDPYRVDGEVVWLPPMDIGMASDVNMPHVWVIFQRLWEPLTGGRDETLFGYLVDQTLYTLRAAFIGFTIGGLLGIGLAVAFVHSGLVERAFVPYVVASQTIPIIALAPLIVYLVGQNVTSVVIVATYLSFFPVTIAMLRGLRSPDPRALELMRSYAASKRAVLWKVRFPASLPYLFTAMKITATASIVGAIVGEGSGSLQAGLGRALVFFSQQYTVAPEKLWGAILFCSFVGVAAFGLVRLVEMRVVRVRPGMEP